MIDNHKMTEFIEIAGLQEEPIGMHWADNLPDNAILPGVAPTPSKTDEDAGRLDYGAIYSQWKCAIGQIRLARLKGTPAAFDATHYGCIGGAFQMGFFKPMVESIVQYVSTGETGNMPPERYIDNPDRCRQFYDQMDPEAPPKQYTIFKKLSQFDDTDTPEFVTFFDRPEIISGLHQYVTFVTGDFEVVASPWGPGCGSIVSWPRYYKERNQVRAVIGSWDVSCRKYVGVDEISLTVPYEMFVMMVNRWRESFYTTDSWQTVLKRARLSTKKWTKGS